MAGNYAKGRVEKNNPSQVKTILTTHLLNTLNRRALVQQVYDDRSMLLCSPLSEVRED